MSNLGNSSASVLAPGGGALGLPHAVLPAGAAQRPRPPVCAVAAPQHAPLAADA